MATSAAGALALSAGVANAEPNGWYGALDAGWHSADAETDRTIIDRFELEEDWAGFARLGYRFDQNWRVELEGGYRAADIDMVVDSSATPSVCNLVPAAGACETPDGQITATTLMANVIYDFGDADARVRPFLGLGAGVNRVNTEFLGTLAGGRTIAVGADDSSTDLAARLELTRERVRQIQLEALGQLRRILKRNGISRDALL